MKCWECEAEGDVEYHHPVPESRGGTKTIPLCAICHSKAHHTRERNVSASVLIKEGLQKAKERGVILGNPNLDKARLAAIPANKKRGEKTRSEYSPIIKKIRDELGEGSTLRHVSNRMNEMGIKGPKDKPISHGFVDYVEKMEKEEQ
jgi:hypothetical protein|tara:strand:+ start:105 stop:545 length:441 start_codon:yes stop_codon:yes gene_type:complete